MPLGIVQKSLLICGVIVLFLNPSAKSQINQKPPAKPTTAVPNKSKPVELKPKIVIPDSLQQEAGELIAKLGQQFVWQAPVFSGQNPQPNFIDSVNKIVYIAEGNTVTKRELSSGKVLQRWYFSGFVSGLEQIPDGMRVSCKLQDGIAENFSLKGNEIVERVVFEPSQLLLASLEDPARESYKKIASSGVVTNTDADPLQPLDPLLAAKHWQALSSQDPSNPFYILFLAAAELRAGKTDLASTHYKRITEISQPFYLTLRIAALLEQQKQPETAQKMLDKSSASYAANGYDPGFRIARNVMVFYGDPLGTVARVFKEGDVLRGASWLGFLRSTMPKFEGSQMLFAEYANFLDKQGEPGLSAQWKDFVQELAEDSPLKLGENGLPLLSVLGLLFAVASLLAYFLSRFALGLRYASVRSPQIFRMGGELQSFLRAPLARLRHATLAYARPSERINLMTLLLMSCLGLWCWSWAHRASSILKAEPLQSTATQRAVLGTSSIGTLGGAHFWAKEADALHGRSAALMRGVAAQLDKQNAEAIVQYEAAAKNPAALNNLGILEETRGNAAAANIDYRSALSKDPGFIFACQNISRLESGNAVANACGSNVSSRFQLTYSQNETTIAFPNNTELLMAKRGEVIDEPFRFIENPLLWLSQLPSQLPMWLRVIAGLVLAVLYFFGILWLFVPRPKAARTAKPDLLHHALALLVPGTGFLSEAWGLMLLLPWTCAILLLLARFKPGQPLGVFQESTQLGLAKVAPMLDPQQILTGSLLVLFVIYVVNFLAWLLELLQQRNPGKTKTA